MLGRPALAESTTLSSGGFVRHSEKTPWTKPELRRFDTADELAEHYNSRGTPEQRARLKILLELMRRGAPEKEQTRRRA
jgi:hypothetical protein